MLHGRLKQNAFLEEDGGARSSSQLVYCSPRYINTHIHNAGEKKNDSVPVCLSFRVRRRERENESMCDVYR